MASASAIQIGRQAIIAPAIRPRPLHYRVPFYKLPQHTVPVKWSLYRPLLRAAPSLAHKRHIQQRWRLPSRRHQVSPRKTVDILIEEHEWLDTYRQAGNSARLQAGSVQEAASRMAALDDFLARQAKSSEVETLALDEYHQGLRQTAPRLKPVLTPSFIFPTLINPPLPRLKPQPLHMTMPMFKRRAARNRRTVREQSWKEMLVHSRQEQNFDASLGVSAGVTAGESTSTELATSSLTNTVATTEGFIRDALSDLRESNERDFARLKLKFSKEMLQAANESRRKRPEIIGHIRRKTETARKLQHLYSAVSENE